ncbi:MAG TPA: STAS domain-containing protein [Candidatus Krumholzibacteria bacterium]|nr:STAS domain-containing protein [Candidatus Krumholzibacteria bacterium]
MKFSRHPADKTMVLEISGKIMGGPDHDRFKAEIKSVLEEGYSDIVLDLADVPWINSTGLGILISGYHSVLEAKGTLRICSVKERVLSIFYVSQLEKIFAVYPDRQQALAARG